jgi:RNA polymerase sigma-70 factor, ECF subfamily
MTDSDERLLVEAAQLDPSRFAELYDRYFDRVFAFVIRRVRDRDVAEEITADVFHQALAHLPSFESRGAPFAAWLIRIAANAVVDRARRAGREVVDSDGLPDTGAQPPDDLERAEESARLFRLVGTLPGDQRAVIVDRFVEDRSIRETAQRLGRSEGAIKQLQHRALETLRRGMRAPAEDGDA